ncbi:hypothetical protein YSA_07052 [Pseudomonas putida ND6]|uniref:Uncharacterized protein n=1 Tax=Pseudomonas putida ND6 TaxID=231023 RepID=I3UYK3_PSEPU|nr:hypothetical protein YSA_07052 [Pseudomonas putida ND6]
MQDSSRRRACYSTGKKKPLHLAGAFQSLALDQTG